MLIRTKIAVALTGLIVAITSTGVLGNVQSASAASAYYFANSGSDNAACTLIAPCKTLSKASSLVLGPGDSLAFNKGDTFTGGLVEQSSGDLTARINVFAYGTGADPIFTGGVSGDCINLIGSFITVDGIDATSCGYAGFTIRGSDTTVTHGTFSNNAVGGRSTSSSNANDIVTGNNFLNNNILNQNSTNGCSGAFGFLGNGPVQVTNNFISGSTAYNCLAYPGGVDGSGIELYATSNAWVHHNVILDSDTGVEMGSTGSGNAVEYNKIESNTADTSADGIVFPGSQINVWVAHNSVDIVGSGSQGIVCYSSCATSTTIRDNAVKAELKGFYTDNAAITVRGNVINGTVQGITLDSTNSTAPVQFVSEPTDLHLQSTSPAIDRGTYTVTFAGDLDGNSVLSGTASDSGAYEFQQAADTVAPTVSITAPIDGATVSGSSVSVSANASDNVGVVGVQFKLDGANLGSEDLTAPYSVVWDSTTTVDGTHSLTATARDAAGNSTTATPVTVTVANQVPDTTPPTVSMTAPADGSTIAGSIPVSANALDNVAVVGVQFKLDGVNLGAEDTSSPYSITWDSTTVSNGSHTLSAVARDAAGNTATATPVNVTVSNVSNSLTFAAFGDTCSGTGTGQECNNTANNVRAINPYRLIHLGDYQYQNAGTNGSTYQAGYQTVFNGLHGITDPTYGSTHDTCDGSGAWECYPVSFMNSNGAPEVQGRLFDHQWGLSWDTPNGWHVVDFNYRQDQGGNLASLTADLDAHPSQCLLAFDHAPVIGSPSSQHSTNEANWARSVLVSHGVDLILNGHQHFYERNFDPAGFTDITNGEGGIGHYTKTSTASTEQAYNDTSFGVVKLVLTPTGWTTDFVPNSGASLFTDHASGTCG